MSDKLAKRFWSGVEIRKSDRGGFELLLDGRVLRTPAKAALVFPTEALANLVAEEWRAQDERIDPSSMPATRLSNSAVDKVVHQHSAIVDMLAAYAGTDLLCYRAQDPQALIARQAENWDPILDWAAVRFGHKLRVTTGLMPVAQDAAVVPYFAKYLSKFDPFTIAGLHDLITISGSMMLALACFEQEIEPNQAYALSCLDEIWQEELWGIDAEASALRQSKSAAFLEAEQYLRCLHGPDISQ